MPNENEVEIFKHELFGELRAVIRDGKPWFIGNDAAKALGYERPRKAIMDHCKGSTKMGLPSGGGKQDIKIIPEADLYHHHRDHRMAKESF
jgi:Prophage antirepressor